MIDHVSIGDIAIKLAEYRDFRLTHVDILEWARAAMMSANIPKHEVPHVLDLLQDISCSTPVSMRRAIEEHNLLLSRVHSDGERLYFDR